MLYDLVFALHSHILMWYLNYRVFKPFNIPQISSPYLLSLCEVNTVDNEVGVDIAPTSYCKVEE